jgi:peptidoglycan/xylan/chitin deacetylase (PgdA/CDA1 family)
LVSARSRALLSSAGLAAHRLARLVRRRPSIRILYYHSISDAPIRSRVTPQVFEQHVAHLVRGGYRLRLLSEAVRMLRSDVPIEPRTVVLTLDDGFRDNYEHAFPILSRWSAPATIFLTAAYIGTDRLPTLTRTDFVPSPLDWAQVREMQAGGIEFGSHTMTHPLLSQVPLETARREIVESRSLIEDRLGAPVAFFCYPRGDFSLAVKRLVDAAGYRAACTTQPGVNDRHADLFALRRTYVGRDASLTEFAKRVEGGYDLLQLGLAAWRRLRAR